MTAILTNTHSGVVCVLKMDKMIGDLTMIIWNNINMVMYLDSHFPGCVYYQRDMKGGNLQGIFTQCNLENTNS